MTENKVTLYNITQKLIDIAHDLEQSNGEITEESESALVRLQALLLTKTDSICGYRQSQVDYLDAIDKRISDLQDLKKVETNKLDRFDDYVLNCMKRIAKTKISGEIDSIQIRRPVKHVEITDFNQLPLDYIKLKVERRPDKIEIKNALKRGDTVPGAQLVDGAEKVTFKTGR